MKTYYLLEVDNYGDMIDPYNGVKPTLIKESTDKDSLECIAYNYNSFNENGRYSQIVSTRADSISFK